MHVLRLLVVILFVAKHCYSAALNRSSKTEADCQECTGKDRIFFKVIWFNKEILYQCYSLPSLLSQYATVVDAACSDTECNQISSRTPKMILNRTEFRCNVTSTPKDIQQFQWDDGIHFACFLMGLIEVITILVVFCYYYRDLKPESAKTQDPIVVHLKGDLLVVKRSGSMDEDQLDWKLTPESLASD
jgi:hypothetical protein